MMEPPRSSTSLKLELSNKKKTLRSTSPAESESSHRSSSSSSLLSSSDNSTTTSLSSMFRHRRTSTSIVFPLHLLLLATMLLFLLTVMVSAGGFGGCGGCGGPPLLPPLQLPCLPPPMPICPPPPLCPPLPPPQLCPPPCPPCLPTFCPPPQVCPPPVICPPPPILPPPQPICPILPPLPSPPCQCSGGGFGGGPFGGGGIGGGPFGGGGSYGLSRLPKCLGTLSVPSTSSYGGGNFAPPVNDCCCRCASPCRFTARARTHGARIFTVPTDDQSSDVDPTCNSEKLRAVIEENITEDPTSSKRAIQKAAEQKVFSKVNVICAKSDFSYLAYTDTYCQASVGDVTCYAFRPLQATETATGTREAASESSSVGKQRSDDKASSSE